MLNKLNYEFPVFFDPTYGGINESCQWTSVLGSEGEQQLRYNAH